MATAVVTVVSGGLPVIDVTATFPRLGLPVTEASRGIAVTRVTTGGTPVTFSTVADWPSGGGAASFVTWETATAVAVTLSGDNLVATNTGTTSNNQGAKVIASNGKTSGKYYFEVTMTAFTGGSGVAFGIGPTTSNYINMSLSGTDGNTIAGNSQIIYANTVSSATLGGGGNMPNGTKVGIAADIDNRRIWFRIAPSGSWNNNGSADPPTNVGGFVIPSGTFIPFVTFGRTLGAANNIVTANFGASAFTGAVPSGFTSGWPA